MMILPKKNLRFEAISPFAEADTSERAKSNDGERQRGSAQSHYLSHCPRITGALDVYSPAG
jgi:hypothetical protein